MYVHLYVYSHVVATKHDRFEVARNTNKTINPTSSDTADTPGGRYEVEAVSDQRMACFWGDGRLLTVALITVKRKVDFKATTI